MANKSALFIGINKYPYLEEFAQLNGCLNDVSALKAVLEAKFEFPSENILTLLDEQATRNGILDAMKLMLANCGENDSIVFFFAGHGSRTRTRKDNKPSGWYETIMPFDSGRKPLGTNRDITDDEIYEWLMALSEKTSNIVLIFDSCYAGSIIRNDIFEPGTRGIPDDDTIIHETLPPIFFHNQPFAKDTSKKAGRSGWLPISDKYVLLAACAEYERAHLFKKSAGDEIIEHGALTYFLCEALREAKSGDTYRDIWEQVYLNVKTLFEKQNVQLEGNRDRVLFGLEEFSPFVFLLVKYRQKNHLILSGGTLHGVETDSQWAIYPPGTKHVNSDTKILGKIKVVNVQITTANAIVIEEDSTNIIKAGSRAVEIAHLRATPQLRIWLENVKPEYTEQFNQLAQNLGRSPLLEVTTEKDLADVRVHLASNFTGRQISDSSENRTENITEPFWAIYGRNDSLLMPPRLLNNSTSNGIIVENLERFCRYRRLVELRNPDSSLHGQIDFIILRQNRDLSWSEAKPIGDEQKLVICESERIALKIVNRFEFPVFFSILDLGLSKGISLLYPPPGASIMIGGVEKQSTKLDSQIAGKGVVTLGMSEDEIFALSFPPNFPFAKPVSENTDVTDEGLEIFKLIVTTRPHDLSFLRQEQVRAPLTAENPIENLIIGKFRGDENFDQDLLSEKENEWLATEKFFFLKRD